MNAISDIRLNDGRTIPQLGFGTYGIAPEGTAAAVRAAIEAGYRHIDTAEMYANERGVGARSRAPPNAWRGSSITASSRSA